MQRRTRCDAQERIDTLAAQSGSGDDPEVVIEFVRLLRLCDKLQVSLRARPTTHCAVVVHSSSACVRQAVCCCQLQQGATIHDTYLDRYAVSCY